MKDNKDNGMFHVKRAFKHCLAVIDPVSPHNTAKGPAIVTIS